MIDELQQRKTGKTGTKQDCNEIWNFLPDGTLQGFQTQSYNL